METREKNRGLSSETKVSLMMALGSPFWIAGVAKLFAVVFAGTAAAVLGGILAAGSALILWGSLNNWS